MPSDLHRTGFLFNYRIQNPEIHERRKLVPVGRRFEQGHLEVLTRGELIPHGVLQSYQKKSGVDVRVTLYRNGTEMQRRVAEAESFDLVCATGFLTQILAQREALAPLNFTNIPNFRHVAPHFRGLPSDPENTYSVALVWHTIGIAYNAGLLDETPRGWRDLFEPSPQHLPHVAGRAALIASPYRVFAAALMQEGFTPNTRDPAEMAAAADYLRQVAKRRQFLLVPQEEMAGRLAREEILIAMAHSSDVTRAAQMNPNIAFIIPEEGTWVTFDTVAVLRRAGPRQKQIAEDFINYLLYPTVAAEIANTALQSSTVPAAAPYLSPVVKLGPSSLRPREGWVALTGDAASDLQNQVYSDLDAAQPLLP